MDFSLLSFLPNLFYHVTHSYDAADADEERIPWDDPEIGFDWSIQNR